MKAQQVKDPRPPEQFRKIHDWNRTHEPNPLVYETLRLVLVPFSLTVFRLKARGRRRIPRTGPVILAPNHGSFMDHFLVGSITDRQIRFMAKSQTFKGPLMPIFWFGGVFPVMRGRQDEEAMVTAKTILRKRGLITMYYEGGRSRTGETGKAKAGIGRLALEEGATVVPIAIYGSNRIRDWKKGHFPAVRIQIGEPRIYGLVENPTREQQYAVADRIAGEVNYMLSQLDELFGNN